MRSALRVEPVDGEFARYRVESQTRDLMHMVDLCQYEGAGACTCEWNTIHAKACTHIRLARIRFDRLWVRPFLASQVDGPTPEFLELMETVIEPNANDDLPRSG